MEPELTKGDITYKSELTPTPIARLKNYGDWCGGQIRRRPKGLRLTSLTLP